MIKRHWPILFIFLTVFIAFYPIFQGKIPLNARNLVAFFSPWYYLKFPGFPVGVPSKPGMLDQIRLYYPYMKLTQDAYQHGELPLWNPYNFAGNPHMAEWQSGVFYPLHILLPFLPLPVYWTFYQIIGFFLAGLFTYWFLRNLKLSKIASLLGGTTFMLCSFMITWNMEVVTAPHSILWLPLILLSIDKIIARNSRQKENIKMWWLIGLFSLVFSILAGYWQTTLYVMAVVAIYILYRWLFGRAQIFVEQKSAGTPEPRTRALATHARRAWEQVSVVWGLFLWLPLSLCLTSFHLLPTLELLNRSSRSAINLLPRIQEILLGYLLPWRHLITLIIPDFYGHPTTRNYFVDIKGTYYEHAIFVGTIPVILALASLIKKNNKHWNKVIFWLTLSIAAASLSFNTPWARWIFQARIPLLSTGIANRILFIPAFGLAVLSGIGLDLVRKKENIKKALLLFGTTLILLTFLVGDLLITKTSLGLIDTIYQKSMIGVSLRNLIMPAGMLIFGFGIFFISKKKEKWINYLLFFLVIAAEIQNIYQFHKFTAFSETQFIYPEHSSVNWLKNNASLNRFIGYNGQYLNNDFATFFGISTIEGYDSLNDYRRTMFIHSAVEGRLNPDIPRSADTELGRDLNNQRTIRLMQLFGIRYLVDHPEWIDVGKTEGKTRLSQNSERLVFQDGDWKIWEYLDAYPRAFLAGQYEIVADGQPLIDRLYDPSFDPRQSLLLTQKPPREFNIQEDQESEVKIVSYSPTKIIFKTSSKTDQLLFLSDTWYPSWWTKMENGRRLPVLIADYALRTIPIPKGDHTITMWYFPNSFRNGLMISFITFITIIIFMKFISLNHEKI